MQTVKTSLLLFACLLCLAACGLKGPLYLSEEGTSPPASAQQESETDSEQEKSQETTKKKDNGSN
jgi:predicted small lipoprotein YifL